MAFRLFRGSPSELEQQFSFHKFRKLRLHFGWMVVACLLFFSKSTHTGFAIGVPIIVLGEAVRLWAHGYLRKARKLATDGPYAYVRNPLYVGNFLIGLGFCVIFWNLILIFLYTVGFYGLYWVTVRGEEQRLLFKFGADYEQYVQQVPRFIPRFTPYPNRIRARFARHRIVGHGEHISILAILLFVLILFLRQEIFQNGQSWNASDLLWINGLVFIVSLALIILSVQRWLKKNPL